MFADADLQSVCDAQKLPASAYPHGFVEAARRAPPGPWFYTGALENHPSLIRALARERPLWGNAAEVLRRVRSPVRVAKVLQDAGLPCPALADSVPPDPAEDWLVKPRRSAGGNHVRPWRGQPIPVSCFCQEFIEGDPCSALFVGRGRDPALFLGATRQLIGVPWLNAEGFRYCGNIGPLELSPIIRASLHRLGDVLARSFRLRGFFGIDYIQRDGVPWPVEINPRYTAAIEVLERAADASFFGFHREVFSSLQGAFASGPAPAPKPAVRHGKAILFARTPVCFPAEGPWCESLGPSWSGPVSPDYADIPHPLSHIDKGQPILTMFARGATEAACLEALREKAQALDRRLSE